MATTPAAPNRFRRKLALAMLGLGVLPVLVIAVTFYRLLGQLLRLSVAPIGPLLDDVAAALEKAHADADLLTRIDQARMHLTQLSLARAALIQWAPWLVGITLFAFLALLVAWVFWVGRRLTSPIRRLAEAMLRVARGERAVQVESRTTRHPDELDFLAQQFNAMERELESQRERLLFTEKIAAWQDVARALGHELKNPLTAMRMAVARLKKPDNGTAWAAKVEDSAQLLEEELEVLLRLTQAFSEFARMPAPKFSQVNLGEILRDLSELYGHGGTIPITCSAPDELTVWADADQLRRAFSNLLKNAVEASDTHDVPIEVCAYEQNTGVTVSVRDHGCGHITLKRGLPPPGSSTKPSGSGLGIPMVQKIIHEHGGRLHLVPAQDRGAIATVLLPRADTVPSAPGTLP